ncbi:unnamed protein product [Gadus morhua 'NCC']
MDWTAPSPAQPTGQTAEDGVPERPSSAPLWQKPVGAPIELVPDHNPRSSADSWRRASQPGRKAAPQRGCHWQGPPDSYRGSRFWGSVMPARREKASKPSSCLGTRVGLGAQDNDWL